MRPSSRSTGYPSVLTILAKEKEAGRLQIKPVLFSVGGETLTDDLRERVLRAFPSLKYGILDTYGCTECLVLSFVCSHGRKHVHEDWVILEAVDAAMRPVPDGSPSATVMLTVLATGALLTTVMPDDATAVPVVTPVAATGVTSKVMLVPLSAATRV